MEQYRARRAVGDKRNPGCLAHMNDVRSCCNAHRRWSLSPAILHSSVRQIVKPIPGRSESASFAQAGFLLKDRILVKLHGLCCLPIGQ
jgi:hypothetical protein